MEGVLFLFLFIKIYLNEQVKANIKYENISEASLNEFDAKDVVLLAGHFGLILDL